jgi:hypothetical protein
MLKWQICYILQQTFENPTGTIHALCNSCAKIAYCSSELVFRFLYEGSGIQNASQEFVSCIHLYYVTFPLHSNHKRKSMGFRPVDSSSSVSVTVYNYTYVHMKFFFLQYPIIAYLNINFLC